MVEIADSVIYQKLKDEVVLLNMDNQHYYGLDDVGSAMWHALLEHGEVDSAAVAIERDYEVDGKVLRADLENLVHALVDAGLLKIKSV